MARSLRRFLLIALGRAVPSLAVPFSNLTTTESQRLPDLPGDHRTKQELLGQLQNPAGILAVLLIIGGDIVQKAIAQMTGAMYVQIRRLPKTPTVTTQDGSEAEKPITGERNLCRLPSATHQIRAPEDDIRRMLMWGMPQSQNNRSLGMVEQGLEAHQDRPVTRLSTGVDNPLGHQTHRPPAKIKMTTHVRFVPFCKPFPALRPTEQGQTMHLCIAPVAFSFGWVGYAFSSLVSVFGDGLLMPGTDNNVQVINLGTGTGRRSESWVLGRLVRDLNIEHAPKIEPGGSKPKPAVLFFETKKNAGQASLGRLWFAAVLILVQFIIASAPIWEYRRQPNPDLNRPNNRNWAILLITSLGTCFALATGLIPQWHRERFPARTKTDQSFVLTRGNGHVVNFVVLNPVGTKLSMNLEHLAVVRPEVLAERKTKVIVVAITLCWVFLLLLVGGLSRDSWYLFGVGIVGMTQNAIIASWRKSPHSHGIPMELTRRIDDPEDQKLMKVLQRAELVRPYSGLRLLRIFFNDLKEKEKRFWDRQERTVMDREAKRKRQNNDLLNLEEELDEDQQIALRDERDETAKAAANSAAPGA